MHRTASTDEPLVLNPGETYVINPRPFQETIAIVHTLVHEQPKLHLHVDTWVNSEVDAQALADLEAKQATDDGRAILRTFADLTGRHFTVMIGRWEATARTLDECGEQILAAALKTCASVAEEDEKRAADLRARVRRITEPTNTQ